MIPEPGYYIIWSRRNLTERLNRASTLTITINIDEHDVILMTT